VLAAERMSEAQLVEARTKAQTQQIESAAYVAAQRASAEAAAEAQRIRTEAEVRALKESESAASAYTTNPALLRLRELETLRDLARNANARIYIGFDKHFADGDGRETSRDR
jgi:regulator of protease activity HflC (stomatin/prohibitin superfamily)